MRRKTKNNDKIPEVIRVDAQEALDNTLPKKSQAYYRKVYIEYVDWKIDNSIVKTNEMILLAYFNQLARTLAPSTLWSKYSIIKTMISKEEELDISQYVKLKKFIKERNVGFRAKKSLAFASSDVKRYLNSAPDDTNLDAKVALIIGISGACRRAELLQMTVDDITNHDTYMSIKIPNTKTHIVRVFTINDPLRQYVLDYLTLRPDGVETKRFFLNYKNGHCTAQPMGINKLGKMPERIATWLHLPNPEKYTGHCFRHTSATLLIDAGGSMEDLKRHGGWQSSSVAEGYIADSIDRKRKTNNRITEALIDDDDSDTESVTENLSKRIRSFATGLNNTSASRAGPSTSSSQSSNNDSDASTSRPRKKRTSGPSISIQLNDCGLQ